MKRLEPVSKIMTRKLITLTLFDDLYKAELVIVIGQNPATNHPRMLTALEKCKKNGGKIIRTSPS